MKLIKRQNKQSKQLYCPPCCLRWEPVRRWDYLTVVHTFLGLTNCWWNGHVKDKYRVQKEMCRDIQRDHCRMRERGMGADSVGLEHRKFVSEKARPSSPPQAFDLATCPTSAEPHLRRKGCPLLLTNLRTAGTLPVPHLTALPGILREACGCWPCTCALPLCRAFHLPCQRCRRSFGEGTLVLTHSPEVFQRFPVSGSR